MNNIMDNMSSMLGLSRIPGETDDALRQRCLYLLSAPRYPAPMPTMRLFLLLAKLGLQSPRQYLPVGLV